MGDCAAPGAYTRRIDNATADLPRKYRCVNDTLPYDGSIEEAFWHVYDFMTLWRHMYGAASL